MLICKTSFSKLQSDPNSNHTITVYAIKKRTFRDPNSPPGETDPYDMNEKLIVKSGGLHI